jgi:hypothetical protein
MFTVELIQRMRFIEFDGAERVEDYTKTVVLPFVPVAGMFIEVENKEKDHFDDCLIESVTWRSSSNRFEVSLKELDYRSEQLQPFELDYIQADFGFRRYGDAASAEMRAE